MSYEARAYDKTRNRQVTKTFRRKSDAVVWRQEVQVELRRKQRTTAEETAGELWRDVVEHQQQGISPSTSVGVPKPSTARRYAGLWSRYILPAIGNLKVRDLARADVEAVLQDLRRRELSPSTVANALNAIRVVIRVALDRGLITIDPTSGIRLSRKTQSPRDAMSLEEVHQHLRALDGWLQVLFGVLAFTGVRIGEALALRWQDIDFPGGIISIGRSWDYRARVFHEPKSTAGIRTIPLMDPLRLLLEKHQASEGMPAADRLVFEGRDIEGRPRDYANIRKQSRRKWDAAGLEFRTPHEFRHTFATHLTRAADDVRAAADITGHRDIAFMINRYVHSDPGSLAEAMNRLEARIDADG